LFNSPRHCMTRLKSSCVWVNGILRYHPLVLYIPTITTIRWWIFQPKHPSADGYSNYNNPHLVDIITITTVT
jgi:hypothetical protein